MRAPLVALAMLSLLGTTARADSDVRLYLEPSVTKKLNKKFNVSFAPLVRFDEDISRLRGVMPELTATYRLHKLLRLGVGYRLQYQRDGDGEFVVRHRGQVDLQARYDFGPVEVSYRVRFQEQIREGGWDDRRHTLRNRVAAQLDRLDPWVPAVSAEMFHRLGDGTAIWLSRIRLQAGVTFDAKDHDVEAYYRLELPQNDPGEPIRHIIGLGYQYDL